MLVKEGQELDEKTQPIRGQNGQLVHWWVLVYSGWTVEHDGCGIYLWRKVVCLFCLYLWDPPNGDASDGVLGLFGKALETILPSWEQGTLERWTHPLLEETKLKEPSNKSYEKQFNQEFVHSSRVNRSSCISPLSQDWNLALVSTHKLHRPFWMQEPHCFSCMESITRVPWSIRY